MNLPKKQLNLKKYQPIIEIIVSSILVYSIHKLVFFVNKENPNFQNFYFPIELIYGFFLLSSLLLILLLLKVKQKNIDNVGYTFLFVTTINMIASYAVLYPIMHSENINRGVEKINFFIIFALFLTIETLVTIRILNNKQ
jgi:hypothetical protein